MSSAVRTRRHPEFAAFTMPVPFAHGDEGFLEIPEHVGDGHVRRGDAAGSQRLGIAVAEIDQPVDDGRSGSVVLGHGEFRRCDGSDAADTKYRIAIRYCQSIC